LFECRALRDELRSKNNKRRKKAEPPLYLSASTPTSVLPSSTTAKWSAAASDEEETKKHDDEDQKPTAAAAPETAVSDGTRSIVEVADLSADRVLDIMESIAVRIAHQVLSKKGLSMDIPSRAASNQIYIKEWDRIVLGGKRSTRSFLNVKESRKTAVTMRVFQLIHAVLVKRIHITKRDLFYTDVKLFVDQAESDGVLDDVATMVGCTRSKYVCVFSLARTIQNAACFISYRSI
jgi:hypothetical protein